ncbi:MAG: ABC transporter substrate-binding protein [Ruminococcaceae bacterium]|nr:ABC transporter substrate-binding protein [Oscillospiraceae bacterium]
MNKKEILEKVLRGYDVKVPNVLPNLSFSEIEETPMKKESLKKKYIIAAAVYAAACLVILATIPFIINTLKTPDKDDPIIPGADETFADKDFDGEEFVILGDHWSLINNSFEVNNSEDTDPGILDRAVIKGFEDAERKYNIQIKAKTVADPAMEAVMSYQCGQKDHSALCDNGYELGEAALEGYLCDISHLSEIDLTKSYWLPHTVDDLTVSGKLYFLGGKLSMAPIEDADFLYYNMDIVKSMGKKDIFEMAKAGEWTYDVFMEYVISSEKDLDGNGEMSTGDRYSGLTDDDAKSMLYDIHVADNGDGTYEFIPYTEGSIALYYKYKNDINGINYDLYDSSKGPYAISPYENKIHLFGDGRSLFLLNGDTMDMGDDPFIMDDNVGIVPYPKKFETAEYTSTVRLGSHLMAIPLNCNNIEMTATVLEYLAASSERELYPAYYGQYTDTEDEEINKKRTEMLDMILDTVSYDWTDIYLAESELHAIEDRFYASGSFASVVKRYFAKIQDDIDFVADKIRSLPVSEYSTDEEAVIFGTKPLVMPFSGNMSKSDIGRKTEIVYDYLYGLTSDDKIYTTPELTAVLEGDPTRLLAVTFMAFSSDGKDIVDADALREALAGDKDHPVPEFARSEDYSNAVSGLETVIYMTGEDFRNLTPPEGMRVVAGLVDFPDEGGALSYISTQISNDEEVIVYYTYDHFDKDTSDTADTPEDKWEAFELSVKQYYDDSYLEECKKVREDGTLAEKLKKYVMAHHDGANYKLPIEDFMIVPELCRVQMRVNKEMFIRMQDNKYITARIVKEEDK